MSAESGIMISFFVLTAVRPFGLPPQGRHNVPGRSRGLESVSI